MKNSLYELLAKTKEAEELRRQVKGLAKLMEEASAVVDACEIAGDTSTANVYAGCYNIYNETRITTHLRLNKLEREILELELRLATSN